MHDGVFLDGWSLADIPVRITLAERDLCIVDESGHTLRTWSLAGLTIDAMQEGETYHLSHDSAPHEELVLKNPELARELLARTRRVTTLPGGRHKLAFGLACLVGLAALMGGFYALAPRIARFAARRIPLEHERALGAELELVVSFDRCENTLAEAILRALMGRLAGANASHYRVRIVRMAQPNAFAMPGGLVLVTDGLLEQAESAEELAGVLAHEVEHIEQRHVLAGALRDVLLTALWSLTFGDYSGLMVIDPSTAYRIANLEFTREDEAAADRGAIARLHRAGASHRGLLAFLERFAEADVAELAWLESHPSTRARLAALGAAQDVEKPRPLLSHDELEALRQGCR